ncbi:MAG: MarR family transcriptional regulator, partial [Rhodospirillales bacterium]|nr:MarR family transcriptional regulator [Rhodospirillales bacterium]
MQKEYLELTRHIERMHRRFLDVLRAELVRLDIKDVNAVQALLLANIGGDEIIIRDLVERGYYQGSNVSYNIKKMAEAGLIEHERSEHDRRSVRIKLTQKAIDLCARVKDLEARLAAEMEERGV